ncbi:MAG TPA: hypothetical protein VJ065_03695 [Patescibacteria group bacterium]|nr:hypothetical protein [Patescibacteria group bacterium]
MVQGKEQYLSERSEYNLRVPKVPRQSVEVFGRDVKNGDYGLSADKTGVLLSYVSLQQTLNSFDDLTFSPEFLDRLPEELRGKLGENLFSGIALADLEIPTTDKVLLARMLAADRLTETLSQSSVEVWITPQIQKDLGELGFTTDTGLQELDYSQLSLQAKLELVEVMEHQEAQVHTILAARQRFPKGIPPLGLSALLSGQKDRTMFDRLKDFESQYKAARQALDDPFLVQLSEAMEERKEEQKSDKAKEPSEEKEIGSKDMPDQLPIEVEVEAKGTWWNAGESLHDLKRYDEILKKVAAYLRPKYADKSIYEILGADSDQDREEILAAFWRTGESRHINFGDEGFMRNNLYLNPDGNLDCHFHDEVYGDRENSVVTGSLTEDLQIAMVDQAIKWIQAEMLEMQKIRGEWEKTSFNQKPSVEITLAIALGLDRTAEVQEEIDGIPKWFFEALSQEAKYFDRLIRYIPQSSIDDLLVLTPTRIDDQNRLKSYFDLSNARLERDRRLISNPEELYKDLDLVPYADAEQVKRAYRRIAQETKAIHIGSEADFDAEEWRSMNDRFIRATRAYSVLSQKKLGETRVTTLGRIRTYFEDAS